MPARFRVASYNVLDPEHGELGPWAQRRGNIARTIELAAPELLAVQEAGWTRLTDGRTPAQDLAALTGMRLAAAHASDAILLGPGWRAGAHGVIPLPGARDDRERSAVWQLVEHPDGTRLLIAGAHLSPRSWPGRDRARARQTRRLVRRLRALNRADLPAIVMGDLNSWRGRARVTPLDVLGHAGYRDAIETVHRQAPDAPPPPGTLVTMARPEQLDHILLANGRRAALQVLDARVADPPLAGTSPTATLPTGTLPTGTLPTGTPPAGEALDGPASDHRLVWADLAITASSGDAPPP
ncbi:MAG: endonuclease/exonuclease/phosphatase family protein [Microbacteriaceae bacterium]